MAKDKTVSPRAAAIADQLYAACGAIAHNTREISEHELARQALSGELNGIGGTRLSVAHEVAALASSEDWTNGELVQACALAGKRSNNNDSTTKTVNVFISEMKVFAHPKVRDVFPVISAACQDAWLAEQEYLAGLEGDDKKNADTPVRKFKSRIYHLTIEMARRVKDGHATIETASDVVEWARAHDPDQDEAKVAKQLASAIEKLDDIFANFGHEDIKAATDFLRTIGAKELLVARTAMLAAQDEMLAGLEDGPEPAAPTGAPTMAEGIFDAMEGLLNDQPHLHMLPLAA